MSRPATIEPTSPKLRAVLDKASASLSAGTFDQAAYEDAVREAEAAGATLSDIQCIDGYARRASLKRVSSLH